ncbi:hypothetical protein I4I36_24980 [Klebsiella pneumoniae]|nr:hypothetical protein [Klebsiella pneumoniae]
MALLFLALLLANTLTLSLRFYEPMSSDRVNVKSLKNISQPPKQQQ